MAIVRRTFLRAAGATALSASRVLGANDRVRVALIGSGGRGRALAGLAKPLAGIQLVAASDVYRPRIDMALEIMGSDAQGVSDHRHIFDRPDVDAVIIATPDHWHTTLTLEAVDAGKDVYVEKPVTHDLSEGDKLISGVEKSKQVVATGTQQRSWDHFLLAKELVDAGRLGQITFARTYWFQDYVRTGALTPLNVADLDWERWVGPAKKQPFELARFRRWRLFWDFGGGVLTDLMVHWIDVVQWYMNSPSLKSVHAYGRTYAVPGVDTPDTVSATMEFPENYSAIYYGSMVGRREGGGIVLRGTEGMLDITREGFTFSSEGEELDARSEPEIVVRSRGDGTIENLENWLSCVRSRKTPNANVRAGVASARTAHLANQAMREQRVITL